MEGQLIRFLYALIVPMGRLRAGKRGQQFPDYFIALVLLWAAINQRPRCWALDMENWHGNCPWCVLPSNATVSRRSKSYGVWLVLAQLFDLLNSYLSEGLFKRIDAHPLTVGGASKDPDAKCGFGAGKLANGYKLHEIRCAGGHFDAWTFSAMKDKEPVMAPQLLAKLEGGGYISADNAYDINDLYDLAGAAHFQLIAPPHKDAEGIGHHRHSPWRLHALDMLRNPLRCCGQEQSFYQALLVKRRAIERDFGHEATCPCCHLGALPFWVRRPHRVGAWILCKLIIWLAVQRLKTKDLRAA